jgi:hypothetical protein
MLDQGQRLLINLNGKKLGVLFSFPSSIEGLREHYSECKAEIKSSTEKLNSTNWDLSDTGDLSLLEILLRNVRLVQAHMKDVEYHAKLLKGDIEPKKVNVVTPGQLGDKLD